MTLDRQGAGVKELKSCPTCGSQPEVFPQSFESVNGTEPLGTYALMVGGNLTGGFQSPELAATWWNTRAEDYDSLRAGLQRLRDENYTDLLDQMDEVWGRGDGGTVGRVEVNAFIESRRVHKPTSSLRAENERMHDLVRHQRYELFSEGLITDGELAALVEENGNPGAVARLESYDNLRARVKELEAENAQLKEQIESYVESEAGEDW